MIIGYQVFESSGHIWEQYQENSVLSEGLALKVHGIAKQSEPGKDFYIKAVLQDEVSDPHFLPNSDTPINSESELGALAAEFDGEVMLSNPTDIATMPAIAAARRLTQRSHSTHTIIVPDNVESIWSGDGAGEWLPALVYIPNMEINQQEL